MTTLEIVGIYHCEDERHRHTPACRVVCDICGVLVPLGDTLEGVCVRCWREHWDQLCQQLTAAGVKLAHPQTRIPSASAVDAPD